MGETEELIAKLGHAEAELHKFRDKHPAARANRLVHLLLFAAGGTVLVLAAIGISFGETSVAVQIFVGILLVMPETLGKAAATSAAKSFASSFGNTLGKTIGKRGNG